MILKKGQSSASRPLASRDHADAKSPLKKTQDPEWQRYVSLQSQKLVKLRDTLLENARAANLESADPSSLSKELAEFRLKYIQFIAEKKGSSSEEEHQPVSTEINVDHDTASLIPKDGNTAGSRPEAVLIPTRPIPKVKPVLRPPPPGIRHVERRRQLRSYDDPPVPTGFAVLADKSKQPVELAVTEPTAESEVASSAESSLSNPTPLSTSPQLQVPETKISQPALEGIERIRARQRASEYTTPITGSSELQHSARPDIQDRLQPSHPPAPAFHLPQVTAVQGSYRPPVNSHSHYTSPPQFVHGLKLQHPTPMHMGNYGAPPYQYYGQPPGPYAPTPPSSYPRAPHFQGSYPPQSYPALPLPPVKPKVTTFPLYSDESPNRPEKVAIVEAMPTELPVHRREPLTQQPYWQPPPSSSWTQPEVSSEAPAEGEESSQGPPGRVQDLQAVPTGPSNKRPPWRDRGHPRSARDARVDGAADWYGPPSFGDMY